MVSGPPTGRTSVVAAVRCVVLASAVAVALLGALTGPPAVTAAGVLLGVGVTTSVVRLAAWGLQLGRPAGRTVVLAGATGALVVPVVSGLTLLGPAGTALLAALLLVVPPGSPSGHRSAWG